MGTGINMRMGSLHWDGREGQYYSVATKDVAFLLALENNWKPHLWRQNLTNQSVVQGNFLLVMYESAEPQQLGKTGCVDQLLLVQPKGRTLLGSVSFG